MDLQSLMNPGFARIDVTMLGLARLGHPLHKEP
jgi:hypothetical protein